MNTVMSENKPTTDSELLLQIVGYNQEAYQHLYNRYSATIYSLIKEIVSNPKLAEKILLNVFSVFLKRIEYYSTTSNNVFTWLTLLARNISLDVLKRMKFVEDIPIYSDEYEIEFILPNLSNEIELLNLDERNILSEKVRSWKSQLSEIQNLILSLVYFEGLNEEEIAKRLTVPASQVRNKIIAIMDLLYQQFTGKSSASVKNTDIFNLIKLEPLGCVSSEERMILNHMRENNAEFLWKELGEVQNLIALLSTTIPIIYPPNDLNDQLNRNFIEILQGADVEYPIISPEPPIFKHKNDPLPEVIKLPEIIEKKEKEAQIKFKEPDPVNNELLRRPANPVIKEKPAEVAAELPKEKTLQSKIEATPNSVKEVVQLSEPQKFKIEATPPVGENKTNTAITENKPIIKPEVPKPAIKDEVIVKNKLTPTSSINLKEFFKNDKPIASKPEPITLKDLEDKIKPETRNEIADKINIKNNDQDEILSKQVKTPVEDNPVKPVAENKNIEYNSDIKIKTNLPPKEFRFSGGNLSTKEKPENKPDQSKQSVVKDQSVEKDSKGLPITEKFKVNNDSSLEIKGEIKIRSHVTERPVRPAHNLNLKTEQAKDVQSIKNEKADTTPALPEVKPVVKTQVNNNSIYQLTESKKSIEKPISSQQTAPIKKIEKPVEVKSADLKPTQEFAGVKPLAEKSALKIRETRFDDSEKPNNETAKTPSKESAKIQVKKSRLDESSQISSPSEKADLNLDDIEEDINLNSATGSYDNEAPGSKKNQRRNIFIAAALFAVLAVSGIFIYLQLGQGPDNKETVSSKPVENKQIAEVLNTTTPTDSVQTIATTETLPINTEIVEQPVKNEPKVNLPPLPETLSKEESTYFALNEENNPLLENKTEIKQIAAAKTETTLPPTKKAPVEEEPAFFVAVEEMPQLIGGLKQLQSKIKYPEIAKRVGVEGKVLVQALVDENGNVISVNTLKGIGSGCDEEAMDAVKNSKFTPGKQRGKNVKVQVTIPIVFKK